MLKNKSLISLEDFTNKEIESIINLGIEISKKPDHFVNVAKGKILATLFYEPSTRTRLSFESAFLRLGGKVVGFSDSSNSSTAKGESLADTIRTVENYVDLIAIRHPKEGAAYLSDIYSKIPIINAGDGAKEHPTQTLTDLLTIKNKFGRLDNLKIGVCGDLKYSRAVNSLVKTLSKFKNNKFIMISPKELQPNELLLKDTLSKVSFKQFDKIEDAISDIDILYMTRIQRERFDDILEYEKLKGSYILTREKMDLAKKEMIIMHPLPRVDEISYEVDEDPRAEYFKQAKFGMYVRMSLMNLILEGE